MKYKEEDETAALILVVVTCAALLSLVAIVLLLSTVKQVAGTERALHIGLAALTVMTSWLLVPTMFTLHYADAFYSADDDERPLLFPQTLRPVFWDFAYFSFTIAAACQTGRRVDRQHVDSQNGTGPQRHCIRLQRVHPGLRGQHQCRFVLRLG